MAKLKIKDIENEIKNLDLNDAITRLIEFKNTHDLKLDKLIEKYSKKKQKFEKEVFRFNKMTIYEKDAYKNGFVHIAGIDEVGRGPLSGPVVACAVILPKDIFIEGLNDSKKLSEQKRDELFDIIKEQALDYGIGIVNNEDIDEINILNATYLAMKKAINCLKNTPDYLLIDAATIPGIDIDQKPIIKGDSKSISIAAASILAKVTRDSIMYQYDEMYPGYGFKSHKGYGTKEHYEAIEKQGITPIHRKSFLKNML